VNRVVSRIVDLSASESGWIRMNLSCWILDPDPDPGGQKLPTKIEKVKNFHVLKSWMFSFKGAQAWDIRLLEFSWFLQNKVFLGRWFGGKNINLIFKFLRELRRI
jgi:hypothetical protein